MYYCQKCYSTIVKWKKFKIQTLEKELLLLWKYLDMKTYLDKPIGNHLKEWYTFLSG